MSSFNMNNLAFANTTLSLDYNQELLNQQAIGTTSIPNSNYVQQPSMSTMIGHEVPTILRWEDLEEDLNGPLLSDAYLICEPLPLTPTSCKSQQNSNKLFAIWRSLRLLRPKQNINNGEYFSKLNQHTKLPHQQPPITRKQMVLTIMPPSSKKPSALLPKAFPSTPAPTSQLTQSALMATATTRAYSTPALFPASNILHTSMTITCKRREQCAINIWLLNQWIRATQHPRTDAWVCRIISEHLMKSQF